MTEGFSNKEALIEIKQELKEFREKYDEDQLSRERELAKRPTRAELATVFGALTAAASTVFLFR